MFDARTRARGVFPALARGRVLLRYPLYAVPVRAGAADESFPR
jgi:hypothetical protein